MSAEQAAPKKGRGKLPIILVAVVVLAGAAAYRLMPGLGGGGGGGGGQEVEVKQVSEVKNHPLEAFTVNLSDPGQSRYLRTTITLEYVGKYLEEEMKTKGYRVRDAVISTLRGKTVGDLSTQEKITALRKELTTAINEVLDLGKVKDVYFQEFIIQ